MGQIDHIDRWDAMRNTVTCDCGAVYEIYEDDGTPGCRDVETVNCKYCGKELARHFGTCEGILISDDNVSDELKAKKNEG